MERGRTPPRPTPNMGGGMRAGIDSESGIYFEGATKMFKMRNMWYALFVVIVLALMVAPVGAQEIESGPVMVALGNGVFVDQLIVMGALFFIVALVALAGTE